MVKSFKEHVTEEVEKLPNSKRLNARDAATKGLHVMSRKHVAKFGHPKVGQDHDFYDKSTGDKQYGKVISYDGKNITFQQEKDGYFKGRKHKYAVHWED